MDVSLARRPPKIGRIVIGLILAIVVVQIGLFLITNERLQWDVVGKYLFHKQVLDGLWVTIMLAIVAQFFGMILGIVFATFRLSAFKPLQWVGSFYVTAFRTPPALVQLVFWFNIAYLIPRIEFGLPFSPPTVSWDTNAIVTPMAAAILGLSLIQGAYMTEIVRSGIMSVGLGQRDAARAMGLTPFQAFTRVVFPQAIRVIIPPTGGQFIHVVHGTALVSVIAVGDLLFSVQSIYNRTYEIVPLLIVACAWYLVLVLSLNYLQRQLENHYQKGHVRSAAIKHTKKETAAMTRKIEGAP